MDDHFNKILAPIAGKNATFIPASTFVGSKRGYIFQNGEQGVGYYSDAVQSGGTNKFSKKRKLEQNFEDDGIDNSDEEPELTAEETMEKLLEEAENSGITQLDSNSLKQLLLGFEKKITRNQKMRMKYPDEPSKFMESELELHAEIQELFAIAASPELYPILVQTASVNSLLGMITHENTDISITTVSLLSELTDVDVILEDEENTMVFVDAFVAAQGLELIVQNLSRLDETSDEDAQGVHNSLSIMENLVEAKPELAVTLCEKTHILKFLLSRLKAKKFDANKLYCSEILSILLQADTRNQLRLCTLKGVDGMDELLQAIAHYRKKEVESLDEQECVENLFLCLCSVLLPRENQMRFLACEGFELLMRCLKEQEYAAGCAVNALSYAIMRNKACAEKLIDVGGLKYVFPLLVGKGLKKALRKKGTGEKRNLEEVVLSIVSQLCALINSSKKNDHSSRLLNKFVENEREKLERCVELYATYMKQLALTDDRLEETRARLEAEGDEEELAEFDDEDNILAQRLDGGLFQMHQLAVAITFACVYDAECLRKAEIRLRSEGGLSMEDVLDTLRGHVFTLAHNEEVDRQLEAANRDSNSSTSQPANGDVRKREEQEIAEQHRQLLTDWCALLASNVEQQH